jgi:hypothetical protein
MTHTRCQKKEYTMYHHDAMQETGDGSYLGDLDKVKVSSWEFKSFAFCLQVS